MHSAWIRLNAVVFFAISLLGVAALLSAFTTFFHKSTPQITRFAFNQLRELKPTMTQQAGHRDIDRADVTFDLECDLGSVFNWSVKFKIQPVFGVSHHTHLCHSHFFCTHFFSVLLSMLTVFGVRT